MEEMEINTSHDFIHNGNSHEDIQAANMLVKYFQTLCNSTFQDIHSINLT
jgi:hypothetical protein